MRQNFEEKLEQLNQDLLKMGSMVEERIHQAITALKEQDIELATEVVENDDELDDYEAEIEQKCIKMIALQQPVAKDLRRINMISKMATGLERIGDLAQNIAEIAQELAGKELIKPLVDLPRMAEIVQQMLRNGLDAFVNSNVELAEKVGKRDKEVNELDDQILRELLTYMMEKPQAIKQGNKLMFVSKHLERIGDNAKNIAEEVIYIVTGERVHY
ncbi:phosphate transport system regulatory protein PhoU [Halobacteroides halobius DSM 5150]|uniref:Phosphate-specific transport system accessory protein PhoU n=1 Tax=Halobacteroides halobius (strain ATCC 35273 / DSM 5150 / MD-1) TaxID=748449 RepID=L0K742_HALHC|nr:phosphate signaling complex protein PhoU [Halobacteroides halobius]AGB40811.1 phosphate transport system regulatory protein PhoU [Halobacteroides halobius DSM 5150]